MLVALQRSSGGRTRPSFDRETLLNTAPLEKTRKLLPGGVRQGMVRKEVVARGANRRLREYVEGWFRTRDSGNGWADQAGGEAGRARKLYVFFSFFSAAGKRTLFRISR